jgi:selenocysteine-specific elongation factor
MAFVELEQVIIGTAGHIDHGKTALVKALTGIDTDTLAEEKKRGITIELGFAFMDTPEFDKQIIFIDVPGHEKLIKTMVAGASNIDAALLVIAADAGISVQTLEHFDILKLFGIETGVIALTKSDLVDNQRIQTLTSEVESLVEESFLRDAPIIPVSAVTGTGVSEVKNSLLEAGYRTKARRDTGIFRMPIDRVFTMQGFGAVVAGTILSGEVKIGDKLEVLPDGLTSRVRGLQVHSENIEKSFIGRRTAINLQDVKKEQLRRGQCLCAPGIIKPTMRIDARLHVLKGFDEELKNRARARLHIGADEVICRGVLLDSDKLGPGQSGLIQFVLEAPTVALPKDRFVIRTFSSQKTIGGGTILDAHPLLHKRNDSAVIDALNRFEGGCIDVVAQAFAKARYTPKTTIEIASGIGEGEIEVWEAAQTLHTENRLFKVTSGTKDDVTVAIKREKYLHTDAISELADKLKAIINEFYSKEPYRLLMPSSDLQSRFLKLIDRQVYEALITDLCTKGAIIKRANKIGIAGRQALMKPGERELADKVEQIFKNAGYITPLEEEVIDQLRINPRTFNNIMTSLIDEGCLVRLNDKVTYHREYVEQGRNIVLDHIKANRSITAAELRDKLDVTRKYAIALLEFLDSIFLTRRDGDKRVLR